MSTISIRKGKTQTSRATRGIDYGADESDFANGFHRPIEGFDVDGLPNRKPFKTAMVNVDD